MRRPIKTTIAQAVDYWSRRIDECGLSVDWAEADTHCWRCGCEKHLERCHIVPDSLGGKDTPENIVLLCKRCHAEGPNVTDPDIMWDWIKAYNVPFYETFWQIRGAKEYEFIYKKKVSQEIRDILAQCGKDSTDLSLRSPESLCAYTLVLDNYFLNMLIKLVFSKEYRPEIRKGWCFGKIRPNIISHSIQRIDKFPPI